MSCGHAAFLILGGASLVFAQERATPAAGGPRTVTACVALEADYVRGTVADVPGTPGPALVLTDVASGRPLLNVTGVRESDLARHVGRRVEVTGAVEPPRTTPVVATVEGNVTGSVAGERPAPAGVTPEGAAAHEPSDALPGSVATRTVAEPSRVTDPAYLLGLLPGLRASAFRPVEGPCVRAAEGGARVRAQGASPAQTAVASPLPSPPPVRASTVERVTVRGCLVRQTAGGTALTAQAGSTDALVLSDASYVVTPGGGARGAVPGSSPSDAGSGTVPDVAATAGQAPVDAATVSFQLVMTEAQRTEIAPRVGERIEITGQLDQEGGSAAAARSPQPAQPGPGRVQVAPVEVAHVSTPARRLTVASMRLVGGTCQ